MVLHAAYGTQFADGVKNKCAPVITNEGFENMPLYVVSYDHPNEAGWQEHVMPHVTWLQDRLKDGSLLASGPLNDTAIKSALLIMTAPSLASLKGIVAGDPFATEGLIENMTMREWDPIFGIFNEQSSMPGKMQSD